MPLFTWASLADTAGEVAGLRGRRRRHLPRADRPDELRALPPAGRSACVSAVGRAIAVAQRQSRTAPPPGPAAIKWAEAIADRLAFLADQRLLPRPGRGPLSALPPPAPVSCSSGQPECSFPGMPPAGIRGDLDHTKPYDPGGLTCECNLAPLCRQHHRAEQAPGWRLTQQQPGVMRWQLPSGRSTRLAPTATQSDLVTVPGVQAAGASGLARLPDGEPEKLTGRQQYSPRAGRVLGR